MKRRISYENKILFLFFFSSYCFFYRVASTIHQLLLKIQQQSWAFQFVVWDGYIYQLSDEYVEDVDDEIGEVTKYSDMEGAYSGNFSNVYEKGTKYYAMQGISTEEAIAIEEEGKYRKAIRDGRYGEK